MKCFQERLISNKPNNKYKTKNQVNQQINHIPVFFLRLNIAKAYVLILITVMCT